MGGGGRGMRVVPDAAQLDALLEEARGEAHSAFGDASVFLEKYLPRARHLEVQILGDHHGNLLHLYERDCSVQRRHQKVVEVAPAANLAASIRAELCDAAVELARKAGYCNAGTVEFLYDVDSRHWYFIEVNPRRREIPPCPHCNSRLCAPVRLPRRKAPRECWRRGLRRAQPRQPSGGAAVRSNRVRKDAASCHDDRQGFAPRDASRAANTFPGTRKRLRKPSALHHGLLRAAHRVARRREPRACRGRRRPWPPSQSPGSRFPAQFVVPPQLTLPAFPSPAAPGRPPKLPAFAPRSCLQAIRANWPGDR